MSRLTYNSAFRANYMVDRVDDDDSGTAVINE